MKTKRTLFSIVVFLSVFWVSILFGFNYPLYNKDEKPKNEDVQNELYNSNEESRYKSSLEASSNKYGIVASNKNRLYLYEETDNNIQTGENISGIDGSRRYIPEMESEENEYQTISTDTSDIQAQDVNQDNEGTANYTESIEAKAQSSLETEHQTPQSVYWNIGISAAKSYVNIRDEATTESEVIGKLYKDSGARILDTVDDWYYIESGSVKGYVKSEFIITGIPDEELIEKYGILRISVTSDGLNVREKPDIDSNKLTVIYKNERYPVIELNDEWIKIEITDDKVMGYVSSEYVNLLVDFNKAISKEEEEELKKIQEEEKAKKETEIKYEDEVDYTEEDLKLLACLIHAEAGNQSYDGKLAVANVVLNRVKSKKYPNTIKDVIYQPGQFSVASSGSLKKQLKNYDNYSSKSQLLTIKAAKAALKGTNNIGNRLYFNEYKAAAKKGYDKKKNSIKLGDHLFW